MITIKGIVAKNLLQIYNKQKAISFKKEWIRDWVAIKLLRLIS